MRKLTLLMTLLLAPTSITVAVNGSASYKSLKIGVIERPIARGAGCDLQFPKDYRKHNNSYVFIDDSKGMAQININGKDLVLKLIGSTEADFQMQVGYRHFEAYASGRTRVRVDYVVQNACPPNDEQCSAIVESAIITVHHKGGTKKIKTIGLCGS